MSENQTPNDNGRLAHFTSEGIEDVVVDGQEGVDRTVRPISEAHRRLLEQRGLIPKRSADEGTPS